MTTYGAIPPQGVRHQIGDRADKMCVQAALDALLAAGHSSLTFAEVQQAIDAYMASAAQHGWKLS